MVEGALVQTGRPHPRGLATIGEQQVRRSSIATVSSRRPFDPYEAEIFRCSIANEMLATAETFKHSFLGEDDVFLRKMGMEDLKRPRDDGMVRLLCPPADLMMVIVNILTRKKAPAILLIQDWPRHAWHPAAIRLARRCTRLPHNSGAIVRSAAAVELIVEIAGAIEQLVMTRSTIWFATLSGGAVAELGIVSGRSDAARHPAELVAQHVWSERLESSHRSQ